MDPVVAPMMYQLNVIRIKADGCIIDIVFCKRLDMMANTVITPDNWFSAAFTDQVTICIHTLQSDDFHQLLPIL